MPNTWTGPEFVDDLVTALAARANLTGLTPELNWYTYWPGLEVELVDAVIIGYQIADTQDPAAVGKRRHSEVVTVDCQIFVMRPGAGATVNTECETRARLILQEIDTHLRQNTDQLPQVGDQLIKARVSNRNLEKYAGAVGDGDVPVRIVSIDFAIEYEVRT